MHCLKYARIRVFPRPYFLVFEQNAGKALMRENAGQRKSILWSILCSGMN